MSNFRFKAFNINQARAAMKVSTDACLHGAYYAQYLKNNNHSPATLLDIGAGTGLLSLMLVQAQTQLEVHAVEIDVNAYQDCLANFEDAPWKAQLHLHHTAIQDWNYSDTFDSIICNPPFFENQLLTVESSRRIARHDTTLTKTMLATQLIKFLSEHGTACLLFPVSEWTSWNTVATSHGLHLIHALAIYPNPKKDANRMIGIYSKQKFKHTESHTIMIYDDKHQYTEAFTALLKPYYLYL